MTAAACAASRALAALPDPHSGLEHAMHAEAATHLQNLNRAPIFHYPPDQSAQPLFGTWRSAMRKASAASVRDRGGLKSGGGIGPYETRRTVEQSSVEETRQ